MRDVLRRAIQRLSEKGWTAELVMSAVSLLLGPAVGVVMNNSRYMIYGVALGLTVVIWIIAFNIDRSMLPSTSAPAHPTSPAPVAGPSLSTHQPSSQAGENASGVGSVGGVKERDASELLLRPKPPDTAETGAQKAQPVTASTLTSGASGRLYAADVVLKDGSTLENCWIRDHNPGPIGSGWDEDSIGFARTLDQAADHTTNRASKLKFLLISRIEVLALTAEERSRVSAMDSYDREKLIKANVYFHDGQMIKGIFLLPHYLYYETAYERGSVTRDTVRDVLFRRG